MMLVAPLQPFTNVLNRATTGHSVARLNSLVSSRWSSRSGAWRTNQGGDAAARPHL